MNIKQYDGEPCLTPILDTTTAVPTTIRVTAYMATNVANILQLYPSSSNIRNTFVRRTQA
ncbi:hypothetical protein E2C01_089266 [Portunus trituberculatus]|uniref:Uncharacterized protein n=1 Tax=Portunus trituberculatus TaxID=210409 RepID=A0A5B7JP40_PORTR|nr:hypothetical protein [Portunus trituberculatus]